MICTMYEYYISTYRETICCANSRSGRGGRQHIHANPRMIIRNATFSVIVLNEAAASTHVAPRFNHTPVLQVNSHARGKGILCASTCTLRCVCVHAPKPLHAIRQDGEQRNSVTDIQSATRIIHQSNNVISHEWYYKHWSNIKTKCSTG